MQSFSKRNKIVPNELNLESISVNFNLRILNTFIMYVKNSILPTGVDDSYITDIEKAMTEMGFYFDIPKKSFDNDKNASNLRYFLTNYDKLK